MLKRLKHFSCQRQQRPIPLSTKWRAPSLLATLAGWWTDRPNSLTRQSIDSQQHSNRRPSVINVTQCQIQSWKCSHMAIPLAQTNWGSTEEVSYVPYLTTRSAQIVFLRVWRFTLVQALMHIIVFHGWKFFSVFRLFVCAPTIYHYSAVAWLVGEAKQHCFHTNQSVSVCTHESTRLDAISSALVLHSYWHAIVKWRVLWNIFF